MTAEEGVLGGGIRRGQKNSRRRYSCVLSSLVEGVPEVDCLPAFGGLESLLLRESS